MSPLNFVSQIRPIDVSHTFTTHLSEVSAPQIRRRNISDTFLKHFGERHDIPLYRRNVSKMFSKPFSGLLKHLENISCVPTVLRRFLKQLYVTPKFRFTDTSDRCFSYLFNTSQWGISTEAISIKNFQTFVLMSLWN